MNIYPPNYQYGDIDPQYIGLKGYSGNPGVNGSKFYVGNGIPTKANLNDEDEVNGTPQYVDLVTYTLWRKGIIGWMPINNIKGPDAEHPNIEVKTKKIKNQSLTAIGYYVGVGSLSFDIPLSQGIRMGHHKMSFKVVSLNNVEGKVSFRVSLNGKIISTTTRRVSGYSSITLVDTVNKTLSIGNHEYTIECSIDAGMIIVSDLISLKVIY